MNTPPGAAAARPCRSVARPRRPYAGAVEGLNGLGALLAGVLGLLTGIGATLAFRFSERAQRTVPERPAPEVDDGVVRTLAVLRSAAVVLDDDDRVVRASPPAFALGVVRDGMVVHAAVRELIADVRRTGLIRDEELELPRGPVGPGTVMLQVRVAQVGPGLLLVLAEDNTQARRLEAIRRDFVVNVSHELKTPVGALSLLAETVQDAADDPEAVRRFAGRMVAEAHRLSELVHEILELSRLQVAGALMDIAVRYSPAGTTVGVGVRTRDGLVEIAVVDQGVGISPEEQDRVFERFYRVDPARSRETGGTGLGLSLVKHVAADHGGDVQVWSQPGRGRGRPSAAPRRPRPTRPGRPARRRRPPRHRTGGLTP